MMNSLKYVLRQCSCLLLSGVLLLSGTAPLFAEGDIQLKRRWVFDEGNSSSELVIRRPQRGRFVYGTKYFCVIESTQGTVVSKTGARCKAYFFPNKDKIAGYAGKMERLYRRPCFELLRKQPKSNPETEDNVESSERDRAVSKLVRQVSVPEFHTLLQITTEKIPSAILMKPKLTVFPQSFVPEFGYYAVGTLDTTETKLKAIDRTIKIPAAGHLVIVTHSISR